MTLTHRLNILDIHAYALGPKADGHHFHATIEILAPIPEGDLRELFAQAVEQRFQLPEDAEIHIVTFGHKRDGQWRPGNDPGLYVMNGEPQHFAEPARAEKAVLQ